MWAYSSRSPDPALERDEEKWFPVFLDRHATTNKPDHDDDFVRHDRDQAGNSWRERWLKRLDSEPFLPELCLRHQRRDGCWQPGSVCEDYSAIKAAVPTVGGWCDSYRNAVPALMANLSAPVKGIVGPWVDKYPHFAVPEPRIGFPLEALRWRDRWLKGIGTGVEADPA